MLAINNKRGTAKTGFTPRTIIEIKLQKIESVQADQGILGRLFAGRKFVRMGIGIVEISTTMPMLWPSPRSDA